MEHVPEKVLATKTEFGRTFIVTEGGVYRINSVRNTLERLPVECSSYVLTKSEISKEEVEVTDLIKPSRKLPDYVCYMSVYKYGKDLGCKSSGMHTFNRCKKKSKDFLRGIVKFVVDGETGKLKSAEVVNQD